MKSTRTVRTKVRIAVLVALGAGLVACGGGGGDGGGVAPVGTMALTAVNRDTAAHAIATSLLALSASTSIPFTASSSGAGRETTQSAGASATRPHQRVQGTLTQAWLHGLGAARERPMLVTTNPPTTCAISGTVTLAIDDRDNNNAMSVGDVLTFAFDHCQDTASTVLNGNVSASVIRVGVTTLPSFSLAMRMTQLSTEATNGRHGMALDGTVNLDYAQLSDTTDHLVLTASGPVTTTIHTHLPYTDTLTLQPGYTEDSRYDASLGRRLTTTQGAVHSAALGGIVAVTTKSSIASLDSEPYPNAGSVRIAGSQGVMRLTALSASQVQIDLDVAGDGSFESSVTDDWDWLF